MNPLTKQRSIDSNQESRPQSTVSLPVEEDLQSSSSYVTWITWYCSLPGNDYLVEVPEHYIEDDFNLQGLSTLVPLYSLALDTILDLQSSDSSSEEESKERMIESSAQTLYSLIHQRFLNTKSGLLTYKERYLDKEFGTCPRVGCFDTGLIPVGLQDVPGQNVKLYCPKCNDLYNTNSKCKLDGCHFGTTFGPNLFITYPELIDFKEYQVYQPRIHGFKVSMLSPIGPRNSFLSSDKVVILLRVLILTQMNTVLKADEQNREFIKQVSNNLFQLQSFLTKFEKHSKERLNEMNTRLDRMDKSLEFVEHRFNKE